MINKQGLRSNIQKTNSIWCSTSVKAIQSITSTPSMHFYPIQSVKIHDSSSCQHQKKFQHDTQWLNQTSNYDGPWLITTNSSRRQSNYSSIRLTIDTVRDSSSAISQDYWLTRTIIQEQSKVHYYSALFHFWRGSSPNSIQCSNNSRLSTAIINTRFNLYRPLVYF